MLQDGAFQLCQCSKRFILLPVLVVPLEGSDSREQARAGSAAGHIVGARELSCEHPLLQRAPCYHRYLVVLAHLHKPRQLAATPQKVVADLIRHDAHARAQRMLQVLGPEVAHSYVPNQTLALQLLQREKRVFKGNLFRQRTVWVLVASDCSSRMPVQLIQINVGGAQACKRRQHGTADESRTEVRLAGFAGDEVGGSREVVSAGCKRAAKHVFTVAVSVPARDMRTEAQGEGPSEVGGKSTAKGFGSLKNTAHFCCVEEVDAEF